MEKKESYDYDDISDGLKEGAKKAGVDLESFFESYESSQDVIDNNFKKIKGAVNNDI